MAPTKGDRRSFYRLSRTLVRKAFDQMNVLRHPVVPPVTDETSLAILDAIVAGERDPQKLAQHCDGRCRSTDEEIARDLRGD